ncbi:aminotransferase class III-fold pyridoxal phosphate-dependent enzyme [Ferrigenium sp. UT5]|uniref:aminotransferase class III-fold pyridoxal phosphate-dependent enzyme n=1 Tax=Ferrigenium sp. UT5 TaxID=3242105 RepID=UPI0038B231AE
MTRMTSNRDLLTRSLSAVWHPCTQMKRHETLPLVPIARAEGVWLYDFDGTRYLDTVSSWWVNLFGHCNPRINAALADQLGKLEHVMLAGFTHEPVVLLSERLRELAPAGLGHCFFGSDGASATEIALKMSAHYWRNSGKPEKTQFISLKNSYHGETLGALSVTDVALFRDAYGALIRQNATVMSPDWREAEAGESAADFALRCANALEDHLQQHHARLAAFIVEPLIQGAAGMAMYHPVYLQRARELCAQYGVHLIADEIAVGMGRSGTMFACEQAGDTKARSTGGAAAVALPLSEEALGAGGLTPDFLLLSKGITGGYLPLSIVMTTEDIYQAFYADETARGFLHSHSYTGNPLACRAALATLDIFAQDDTLNVNRGKAAFLNRIAQPLREHPNVRNFRHTGMVWAFEVETPHADFAQRCFSLGLRRGLLLRPMGNTVYFMPPYIISEDEMQMLVTRTLEIIDALI